MSSEKHRAGTRRRMSETRREERGNSFSHQVRYADRWSNGADVVGGAVGLASWWEGKTDWYRYVEREPALEVRIGRVHYRPAQEFLSPEETAQLILTLFRQHPREVRFAGPVLGIDPVTPEPVLCARIEAFFRGCASALLHSRNETHAPRGDGRVAVHLRKRDTWD